MEINAIDLAKFIDILYDDFAELRSGISPDQVHKRIHQLISKLLPLDIFYLGFYEKDRHALRIDYLVDGGRQYPGSVESLAGTLAERVVESRKCVVLNHGSDIASLSQPEPKTIGQERLPESYIACPVDLGMQGLAIICAQSYQVNTYPPALVKLFQIICACVASALESARNHDHKDRNCNVASDRNRAGQQSSGSTSPRMKIEYESALSQNDRLRSVIDLAKMICHEMNQPLTGISGYCALIREEFEPGHHIYADLTQIETQARRLEQLIFNFQSIAQLENIDDAEAPLGSVSPKSN